MRLGSEFMEEEIELVFNQQDWDTQVCLTEAGISEFGPFCPQEG